MRHDGLVAEPTVVLLHGQPDSSASMWRLRRALRDRLPAHARVLAPDRPGYGANTEPATDFGGNVRWLKGFLSRRGPGPVVLLGHSWAGGIAILAATGEIPEVVGIVLLASIGPSCLLRIDPMLASPVFGDAIAYLTLGLGRRGLMRHAARVLHAELDPLDEPYAWASGAAVAHRPLWRSFLLEQRALVDQLDEISAALPAVASPALIINGTSDSVIPPRTPHALAARIPDARRIQIDGGHDVQLRRADQTAAMVADFVLPLLAADVTAPGHS
jgi:pimeloyl-ACP methyl ester carboxylesterase